MVRSDAEMVAPCHAGEADAELAREPNRFPSRQSARFKRESILCVDEHGRALRLDDQWDCFAVRATVAQMLPANIFRRVTSFSISEPPFLLISNIGLTCLSILVQR